MGHFFLYLSSPLCIDTWTKPTEVQRPVMEHIRKRGSGGVRGRTDTVSRLDNPSITIMWNNSHYLAARIPPIPAICIELKNDQSSQHHLAFKCV